MNFCLLLAVKKRQKIWKRDEEWRNFYCVHWPVIDWEPKKEFYSWFLLRIGNISWSIKFLITNYILILKKGIGDFSLMIFVKWSLQTWWIFPQTFVKDSITKHLSRRSLVRKWKKFIFRQRTFSAFKNQKVVNVSSSKFNISFEIFVCGQRKSLADPVITRVGILQAVNGDASLSINLLLYLGINLSNF